MAEGERTWPWQIGFVATGCVALVLTVLAYAGRLPPEMFEADKLIHFTVAGLLAFFLDRATGARSAKWSAGLLVLFGVEEIAQRWSVHRTASFGDYAADVAGVIVLTWLSRRISKTRGAKPADEVAK